MISLASMTIVGGAVLAGILGLIVGSFLNVVIIRFRTARAVTGRSACPICNRVLRWFELLPVISFLLQRGRCRRCQARISWQYSVVELFTGIAFVGLFFKFVWLLPYAPATFVILACYFAILISLLIVIAVYDIRHKIIPDPFVFAFLGLAVVGIFVGITDGGALTLRLPGLWQALSGVVLAFPFAALWFLSRGRLMGFGDVKLILALGYFVGLWAGMLALLIAFWVGALVSVIALVVHNFVLPKRATALTIKSEVPFGPFLIGGALVVFYTNWTITHLLQLL